MLVVETVAKIRRAYFVQGKPIKAICRELRVSRKVVRKVVRSEATEFRYERENQPLPRLGPLRDVLDELLAANKARPSREQLTLIRLFEQLRGRGYEGGYDAVRRYAREWQRHQASASIGAFVPLSFAPGSEVRIFRGVPSDPLNAQHHLESALPRLSTAARTPRSRVARHSS